MLISGCFSTFGYWFFIFLAFSYFSFSNFLFNSSYFFNSYYFFSYYISLYSSYFLFLFWTTSWCLTSRLYFSNYSISISFSKSFLSYSFCFIASDLLSIVSMKSASDLCCISTIMLSFYSSDSCFDSSWSISASLCLISTNL